MWNRINHTNFKQFSPLPDIRVAGKTWIFDEYQKLTPDDRLAARREACNRLSLFLGNDEEVVASIPEGDHFSPCGRFPYEIDNEFMVWEAHTETLEEQLIRRLKAFDWTYQYSDDYSAWRSGEDSKARINNLVKTLGQRGEEIYDEYQNVPQ